MELPAVMDLPAALDRLDGDQELFLTLAGLFVERSGQALDAIQTAFSAQDLPVLLKEAHKLKGSAMEFCARPAVAAAARLEESARKAAEIIPIRKNGRPWKEDCPAAIARNETLRATHHYGRAFWKRWTGYHVRSRIEAKMRCLKAFGERISARDPDSQTAEIQIRVALMNRFNALGTAEIVHVA